VSWLDRPVTTQHFRRVLTLAIPVWGAVGAVSFLGILLVSNKVAYAAAWAGGVALGFCLLLLTRARLTRPIRRSRYLAYVGLIAVVLALAAVIAARLA